jgi:hypothetical protein
MSASFVIKNISSNQLALQLENGGIVLRKGQIIDLSELCSQEWLDADEDLKKLFNHGQLGKLVPDAPPVPAKKLPVKPVMPKPVSTPTPKPVSTPTPKPVSTPTPKPVKKVVEPVKPKVARQEPRFPDAVDDPVEKSINTSKIVAPPKGSGRVRKKRVRRVRIPSDE